MSIIECPSQYKKRDHYRAFVYWPYYYYFYDKPYFTSRYIGEYNEEYVPETNCKRKLILQDGTIIEGFANSYSTFMLVCILIIVLCIMI